MQMAQRGLPKWPFCGRDGSAHCLQWLAIPAASNRRPARSSDDMTTRVSARNGLLASAALLVLQLAALWAGEEWARADEPAGANPPRDGQHDFDFLIGSWTIHLKRLVHPLSGSDEWVDLDGTTVCRTVLDGRAEVEEFEVSNPEKHMHIQGLALR